MSNPDSTVSIPPITSWPIQDDEQVHLITDLHLLSSDPCDHLSSWGQDFSQRDHIVIMGDLFEVWYENRWGAHPSYPQLFHLLRTWKNKVKSLHLIIGNRDVLAGAQLERLTDLRLHWGPLLLTSSCSNLLLMHGDECLPFDHAYQKFRRLLRNPIVRTVLHSLPERLLKVCTGSARARSKKVTASLKPAQPTIIGIKKSLRELKGWSGNICAGHVHMPQIIHEDLDGQPIQIQILEETTPQKRVTGVWSGKDLKIEVMTT